MRVLPRNKKNRGRGGYPKSMWVIENWSTAVHPSLDNPYIPPECQGLSIVGQCPARPGFEEQICTSPIVRINGRRVCTSNNSRYVLGRPNPEFVKTCREKGWYVPTHKHPLRQRAGV